MCGVVQRIRDSVAATAVGEIRDCARCRDFSPPRFLTVVEMALTQAITWPYPNLRRTARVRRKLVQFRATVDDHNRLESALADLQVIAPGVGLTRTDVMVAALRSYLDALEATFEQVPQDELRTKLYEIRDLATKGRQKRQRPPKEDEMKKKA